MEVTSIVHRDKPSPLRPIDVPSVSTHERGKGAVDGNFENGSDLDPDEVWIQSEGFTCIEFRLDGSSRIITVPMDRDLLANIEDIVPFLGPLFYDVEGRTSGRWMMLPCLRA